MDLNLQMQKDYSENELFYIVEKIRHAEIFYSQHYGEEDRKKAKVFAQIVDRIEKIMTIYWMIADIKKYE